jgi:hypothetical protein
MGRRIIAAQPVTSLRMMEMPGPRIVRHPI